MNKLKKLILTIILTIIATIGTCTVSSAFNMNELKSIPDNAIKNGTGKANITISMNDYIDGSTPMYCVCSGVNSVTAYYKVVQKITLNGKTSRDVQGREFSSWYNAQLAYVASLPESSSGTKKWTTTKQHTLQNIMRGWIDNVGNVHHGIVSTFALDRHSVGPTAAETRSIAYANSMDTYMDKIQSNTKVENLAQKSEKDNYVRVGPYNITFTGKLTKIDITDQNDQKVKKVIYKVYDGKKLKEVDVSKIESGKDFYISVPTNANITKIKIEPKARNEVYSGTVWFLAATNHSSQNMIVTEASKGPVETELPTPIETEIFGNIQVVKEDAETRERLNGVQFIAKRVGTEQYILKNGTFGTREQAKADPYVTKEEGGENGIALIKKLPLGDYEFYEIYNPNWAYFVDEYTAIGTATSTPGETSKIIMINTRDRGDLIVEKVDALDPDEKLEGVGFKLYLTQTNKWVAGTSGNIHYVDTIQQADEFKTNADGIAEIKGLIIGDYEVREIYIPPIYGRKYVLLKEPIPANVQSNKGGNPSIPPTKIVFPNKPQLGDLRIIKYNKNNENCKLPNVSFKLQYLEAGKDYGKFVRIDEQTGKLSYVDDTGNVENDEKGPSIFKTGDGKNGTTLGEIYIKGIVVGNYKAIEVENPNYGYDATVTMKTPKPVVVDTVTDFKIPNTQLYVRLSGFVWEDMIWNKSSERTNKFNDTNTPSTQSPGDIIPDVDDELLDGIKVTLRYKETGQIVKNAKGMEMEVTTSSNPAQIYGDDIKYEKYNEYITNKEEIHGAYLFNDVLADEVAAGKYYIEFEYDGLTYTNVVPYINDANGSKAAETSETRQEFNKKFTKIEGVGQRNADDEIVNGVSKNENGGNEHDLTYKINKENRTATFENKTPFMIQAQTNMKTLNGQNSQQSPTGYDIGAHFTWGDEEIRYINLGLYKRAQPDLKIKKDLISVKLTINGYEHTYKYASRFNEEGKDYSDGFNVGVRWEPYERAIYKSDYTCHIEGKEDKELKAYITYRISVLNNSSELYAKVNSIVDYFDSRYTVAGEDEGGGVGTKIDENTGDITETANISYQEDTEYSENGYKKLIINRTPQNYIEPQKAENEEDRIYVRFKLSREAIYGILQDNVTEENKLLNNVAEINSYSTYEKQGNNYMIYAGIDENSAPADCIPGNEETYENDTDSSPALKLKVANARKMTGTVFVDNTELNQNNERQGNGEYEPNKEQGIKIKSITLKEEDGGLEQSVNATIDENGNFTIEGYIPGNYQLIYTWGDDTYTVQDYKGTIYDKGRYDINKDNKFWYRDEAENPRYSDAIDDYSTRKDIDNQLLEQNYNTKTTIDEMNSLTPTMGISIENIPETSSNGGDELTYEVHNIDFGIAERARQVLETTKRVKSMKITLANNFPFAEVQFEKDANGKVTMKGNNNHITYGPRGENTYPENGYVRAEIDNEDIQGTTVTLEYEILVKNQSERDYLSENYYKFGEVEGNIVTITPTEVMDYLDTGWAFNENENSQWTVKTLDNLKELVAEQAYGEESDISTKRLIYTDSLKETKLEPGQQAELSMNVSKELSASDEITLDNEAEVIKINKTGGSKLRTTPGNYVPGKGMKQETDDDMAETILITDSTGANQNYVLPITIGITLLVILATGVVIIKKKVIKKEQE